MGIHDHPPLVSEGQPYCTTNECARQVSPTVPPPASNTGVGNTWVAHVAVAPPLAGEPAVPPAAPAVSIDWLAYTIHDLAKPWGACPDIDLDEWILMPTGAWGYTQLWRVGHITLMANPDRPEMGAHVEISGQGCRELEARGITDWAAYLRLMLAIDAVFTRIDVAFDDHDDLLSLDAIESAVRAGNYTSPARAWSVLDGGRSKGTKSARTIYIGAPSSDVRVRVYDKAAEQKLADTHWVRVELECRAAKAHALALALVASGDGPGGVAAGVLRRYLDFRIDDGTRNQSRWPVADWWLAFTSAAAVVRLTIAPAIRTLETTLAWVERQVAPSLALLVASAGGALDDLVRLVAIGRARWRPQHRAMLRVQLA